jgi:hypothetical protein
MLRSFAITAVSFAATVVLIIASSAPGAHIIAA